MLNKFFIVFLGFFLFSCKESKEPVYTNTGEITDTLRFDTKYFSSWNYVGSYYDKKYNKTLIYFGEPKTEKVLKIFDDTGNELYKINLKKGLDTLDYDIKGLSVFSADTIVLCSFYRNKIAVINSKGEVLKMVDFTNQAQENNSIYELHPTVNNSGAMIINEKSLLLASGCIDMVNQPKNDFIKGIKDFYINKYNSFYFFKIDNIFDENTEGVFKVDGLYKNWYNKSYMFVEPNSYRVIGDKIFVFSIYSNEFLVFDVENFEVIKKVQLISDYTTIGTNPIELLEQNIMNLQELVNQKARSVGYVEDILYDKKSKRYFITLNFENKEKYRSHRFSVIILDENFKKINEIPFTDGKLKSNAPISTDKGIMFKANIEEDEDSPREFYILNF
ncbi:MAG: hypothetical protein AB7D46_05140 [Flavobacteriaceae bacterium]